MKRRFTKIMIFLPLIYIEVNPFTIEVGKENVVGWKIFEIVGPNGGYRWLWIFFSKKEEWTSSFLLDFINIRSYGDEIVSLLVFLVNL